MKRWIPILAVVTLWGCELPLGDKPTGETGIPADTDTDVDTDTDTDPESFPDSTPTGSFPPTGSFGSATP